MVFDELIFCCDDLIFHHKKEEHIFVNKKQEKIATKLLYWFFVNTHLQVGLFMNPQNIKVFHS